MNFFVSSGRGQPYIIFDISANPVKVKITYNQTSPSTLTVALTLKDGNVMTQTNPSITIPTGKSICGFNFESGADTINIPFNRDVSIPEDTRDIFAVFKNVKSTVTINLYKNSAEPNVVSKTNYLESVGRLEGTFREGCSITSPSITFYSISAPAFNYVYIQKFSRYYYVTAITNISNNLWRVDLKCDVLMSYKDDILKLYCVIARQENNYDEYLIDDKVLRKNGETVTYVPIPNSIINVQGNALETATAHNYLLTVVGGPDNVNNT